MKTNWKRRGDGKARTIRPTQAALNLMRKVRDKMSRSEAFTTGMGEPGIHCLLGWMAVESGARMDWYPNDLIYEGLSIGAAYPRAASMFAETVNGPGHYSYNIVNQSAVYGFNDNEGYEATLDALDRTIRYAEHKLGETV